jgi:hypothetical protein
MADPILFYDSLRFALAIGSITDGVFSESWSSQMDRDSLGSFVHVATSGGLTIFYNGFSGQTRVFRLGVGNPAAVTDYPPGGPVSRFWTHVLPTGDLLFFYNSVDGSGAIASIATGGLVTQTSLGAGALSPGWTHVAAMGNTLLFYDTIRGAAALAIAGHSGFRTLAAYEDGALSQGWTHVVASGDRFLFYNIANGSGAIAAVQDNNLITVDNLEAGQFSTGWTHITGNSDGVLFYNADDGSAVAGRIVPGGFASLKQYPAGNFSAGWTHVLSNSASRLRTPWRAIQGYAWPLSVAPGETLAFSVTTGSPTYVTTCVRFSNAGGPLPMEAIDASAELIETPVLPAETRDGQYQFTDFGPAEGGERWATSFTLTIPDDWNSGVYAMKCEGSGGDLYYMPFIVNPPGGRSARLAVIVNTNTWAAYNWWGGYSRYGLAGTGPAELSVKRPNFILFAANTQNTDQYNCRHLLRGELWLLNWLQENGYEVDLWTDLDFHAGIDRLQEYAGIIVSTHPEYWSVQMMNRLKAYLDAGGCLINLGANGLYDAVDIADDFSRITVYGAYGPGRSNLFRQIGQPESAVLGIAFPWDGDDAGNCPGSRVPYVAVAVDHPFMAGIAEGDVIGAEGWSYDTGGHTGGSAAGWEIDVLDQWSPPLTKVVNVGGLMLHEPFLRILATAKVPRDGSFLDAHLVTYPHAGGGWVFSCGSMAFTGSVPADPKVQQILRNVLDKSLGK